MIQFPNKNMSVVEAQVVERLITDILAAGLTISVYDGEDYCLKYATSLEAIMDALASTDGDELVLHEPKNAQGLRMRAGWISLVWGNDGHVISDFTESADAVVRGAAALGQHLVDVDLGVSPRFAPNTTARFWMYLNTGIVRIKIREGQILHWHEGGLTDEGYSHTGHVWELRNGSVYYNSHTAARDCDGPISYGSASICPLDQLRAREDEGVLFPEWKTLDQYQRDITAERAGY